MTKKQVGIRFTLLALIVCTAILGAKLNNGGLNDASDSAGHQLKGRKMKTRIDNQSKQISL